MAGNDPKKGKGKVKIDDLKSKPLTTKEQELTKGGVLSGGPIVRAPMAGGTTPRADTTYTDPDDVDTK